MDSKIRGILSSILITFLILQPLFDVYMAIVGENLDVFGISIATILRTTTCIVLTILVAIYQIKNKYKIKWLISLISYLLLVAIYATVHHFNIVLSDSYFITQGIYSFATELTYVLRLVVPVLLIYFVVILKPDKEQIEKAIISVVFIISLVIIITNILKISFASYSSDNNIINYNIFEWLKETDIPYRESLSKGLFVSANQIGALLAILLPVVVMYIQKNNKPFTYFTLILGVISMVIIGTRVATYGFIITIIAMLLASAVICIIKKETYNYITLLLVVCVMFLGLVIYSKSPAKNRTFLTDSDGMYYETIEEIEDIDEYVTIEEFNEILQDESRMKEYMKYSANKKITIDELRYKVKCKYIKYNYRYHGITRKYIVDIYPYDEDPEFWLELFEEPLSIKGDNRARQSVIIKHIKEINNNYILDTLLGMGATPMNSREYMIENDLISHYYNIGIIGIMLFVSPYATILVYALITILKDIRNRINLTIVALCLSIIMTYSVGYFAGHVIDEYIVTIFVAAISGLLVNETSITGGRNNE